MSRIIDIKINEPKIPVSSSEEAERFAALIEAYKIQNPWKYAMKKSTLEAKLIALGGKPTVSEKAEKTKKLKEKV